MASFATLQEIAIELIGASSGAVALGVIDSEWCKTNECLRLLVLSDHSTAKLICGLKGYGPRKTFLTGAQAGIANGAQLNVMAGPTESLVFVVTGGRWAGTHRAVPPRGADTAARLAELSIENRNPTANPEIPPHAVEDGITIFHNAAGLVLGGATSASVNATYPVIPAINFAATVTISPDEFSESIVMDALGVKFASDGHRIEAANFATLRADKIRALGLGGQS